MSTTSQLLLRSLTLYRAGFLKVFFLALLTSIVAFGPRLFAFYFEHDYITQAPILSASSWWIIVVDITCLTLLTAILWRLQCITTKARESLFDDIKTALRKIPYLIIASIVQALIFIMLTVTTLSFYAFLHSQNLLFITDPVTFIVVSIPVLIQVYLSVYIFFLLYFYQPLILTEDKGPFAALSKSARLVWGNWWKTLCVQLSPWLVYLILLFLIRFVAHINIHVYYMQTENESLAAILFHIVLFALFIPWVAATQLVQLRDLEAAVKTASPKRKPRKK